MANIEMMIQLAERFKITQHYIMKQWKQPIYNEVVEETIHHKGCLVLNHVVRKSKSDMIFYLQKSEIACHTPISMANLQFEM